MTTRKPPKTEADLGALARWYDTNSTADEPGEWIDVDVVADPSVVRSVRLRRSTVKRLNLAAKAHGVGPTELIRRWVEERLDAEDNPSEAQARLLLLKGMTDAMVRELGVPGITVRITAEGLGDAAASGAGGDLTQVSALKSGETGKVTAAVKVQASRPVRKAPVSQSPATSRLPGWGPSGPTIEPSDRCPPGHSRSNSDGGPE
jgi:hypothetical protein